ncbi:mono/diheme cytochrome c family protein [Luteibacter jiangsuensis]|uniref:Mono/diheme cytochrome c family protein n=1 Tax=Luteibacter jiangsuensis TaxID=637577 RepID=A0ABT9SZ15_9GAMM|nr:c-type cytochrome [Luteibacter jiangsuensis]MDQ0009222.1 mono/diheme cytochrome c family protein [Luteibacter jiangsuensis]
MKRFLIVVLLLIVIGVGAYFVLNRTDHDDGTAPVIAGAPANADPVARGEYLARAADCVACHTVPETGKPFAGGVAFKLPFGTIYSSNITADEETGIGRWSDDEFVRAVREGVRKDGKHLYPAFPYTSYTQLSRADVLAIKAYLFTLPKVRQPETPNDLGFPFNQRWAMGFWNAAFFRSQRFEPDASRSPEWNSGAYLAGALGHCAECHTPRNIGYGLKHGQELAGQELQGWRAYNITSDPVHGVGKWSDEALVQYLRTGYAQGHASANGPMGEAVAHSLQFLKPEDTAALVAWLRTVPAREGKDPIVVDPAPKAVVASSAMAPGGDDPSANVDGQRLFEGACASCHQWNGAGQQTPNAGLAGTRGVNDPGGANVTQAILQGVKMRIGQTDIYMPAFGHAYSDPEVAALANYVIHHFGGKEGTVTAEDVAKRRQL